MYIMVKEMDWTWDEPEIEKDLENALLDLDYDKVYPLDALEKTLEDVVERTAKRHDEIEWVKVTERTWIDDDEVEFKVNAFTPEGEEGDYTLYEATIRFFVEPLSKKEARIQDLIDVRVKSYDMNINDW